MSELKCCPFCGGEAEIRHNVLWFWVQCKKCKANSRESSNEDLVIKYWNTRTPMSNIVEKLEEREKYLERAMKEIHENGHRFSEEKAMNERVAIRYAINIVKQEINNGLE